MKKNKLILPVAIFCLFLTGTLAGQKAMADIGSVTGNLERYADENPFAEVFMHTDRGMYAAGESVRIGAWLFRYPDMSLASGISYVYAELLDYYGHPVSQAIIRVDNGTGESQITLPDTLVTGSYLLRGYTSSGRNFLPYGCFMKRITVANPFRSGYLDYCTGLKSVNDQPYSVRFHPEGGRTVNGMPSLIGISAVNRFGYPVRCEATVVNGRDEPVAHVATDSTGTGSFELVPQRGETYSLVPAGTGLRFDLPAAADSGITMRVRYDEAGTVKILLREVHDSPATAEKGGFILIQSRGRLLYSCELPRWEDIYELSIPASRLKEGIMNIALFDREGRFTAERYLMLPETGKRKITLDVKGERGRRQNISIEISPAGEQGQPSEGMTGSISVSDGFTPDPALTLSEYLLSGPEFYNDFTIPGLPALPPVTDPGTTDNCLLGIKSVWIDWRKIASGSWPTPVFPEENGGRYLTVKQSASSLIPSEAKSISWLTSWGELRSLQYAESDMAGRFGFFLDEKNKPEEILIRMRNGAPSLVLMADPVFSAERIINTFTPDTSSFPPADREAGRITDRYQIEKIYGIADSLKKPLEKDRGKTEGRFYGIPDQEINLDDYISLTSMREIFFELVKRIVVRSDRDGSGLQIWDPVLKRAPALFIDLVPVDDAETVLGLDPARVQRIDVISGDYLLGDIVLPGIVSVITRKGTYSDSPLPKGALRFPFRMYDPPVPFIIPVHGNEDDPVSERIPDFRNTVFWKGDLRSDSTGRLRCEFTSPDDAGDYQITVSLIDPDGRPASVRQKISFTGLQNP
jgi:hypothetical protein